eukprot:2448082-Pleurochrysis_carterae.AAC.4
MHQLRESANTEAPPRAAIVCERPGSKIKEDTNGKALKSPTPATILPYFVFSSFCLLQAIVKKDSWLIGA